MRLPSPHLLLQRLFEAPVTAAYAGWTLLLTGVAGSLIFTSLTPSPPAYLLMLATLGWLARLCASPLLRRAWLAVVGLLALGLGLEVMPWLKS